MLLQVNSRVERKILFFREWDVNRTEDYRLQCLLLKIQKTDPEMIVNLFLYICRAKIAALTLCSELYIE